MIIHDHRVRCPRYSYCCNLAGYYYFGVTNLEVWADVDHPMRTLRQHHVDGLRVSDGGFRPYATEFAISACSSVPLKEADFKARQVAGKTLLVYNGDATLQVPEGQHRLKAVEMDQEEKKGFGVLAVSVRFSCNVF